MSTAPRRIEVRTDNFDQTCTFRFAFSRPTRGEQRRTGYLFASRSEGKLYIMQQSACIKDTYTAADIAERERLASEQPLRTGDVVEVEGAQYTVHISGDFSDAGYLRALAPPTKASRDELTLALRNLASRWDGCPEDQRPREVRDAFALLRKEAA